MTPVVGANPVCLIVIDGWGLSEKAEGNAIIAAATPNMANLAKEHASTQLCAHGLAVGLPDALMGNSEVGHLNIGAGRVVYQDIVRIDKLFSSEQHELLQNPALATLGRARRVHLIGLVSDGGVHSHLRHLKPLLEHLSTANVFVHAITDGRDTGPVSGMGYIKQLMEMLPANASLATIVGRYWAMDRDKRWERTQVAVDALFKGTKTADNPLEAIEASYKQGTTDEFLDPIVLSNADARIHSGDSLVFFNFRADRMRQIVEAVSEQHHPPTNIITMTQYSPEFAFSVISPPQPLQNVLAEWLSVHQIPQMHIAGIQKCMCACRDGKVCARHLFL